MRNDLYKRPFYNMMLHPIEEIRNDIDNAKYQDALMQMFSMHTKLSETSWTPFPCYAITLGDLKILSLVTDIVSDLISLNRNTTNDTNTALSKIKQLESYAHLLNMLETNYCDPTKTIANILYNTGSKLGVFQSTPAQTNNCNNQKTFTNSTPKNTTDTPANPNYASLLQGVLLFINNKNLSNSIETIFATMNPIDKNDSVAQQIKGREQNMFTLGEIEEFIKISNDYKNDYNNLLLALNTPSDDEGSPELCNLINNALNTLNK